MQRETWMLTDVERDLHAGDWSWKAPGELPAGLRRRTLRGGLRDGLEAVEVDNGLLRFTVLPDRGMGLWKAWLGDLELGWKSPVKGPVHPRHVPLEEASGIGWLSGFDELLCRCGLDSNGAPEWDDAGRLRYGLHGKIANTPVHRLSVAFDPETRQLEIAGVADESRLFGPKLRMESTVSTVLGTSRLQIVDRVTNLSSLPADLELLYHINFGAPLLSPGATVHVPFRNMAPANAHAAGQLATWQTYPAEQPGVPETVWFFEPAADSSGMTEVVLEAKGGERGVSLEFDSRRLPFFTLWKNPLPLADGYVTGLEPCLNFPNPKSFEKAHGRVATLAPGETREFRVGLTVLARQPEVAAARQRVRILQSSVHPTVHREPQADWSPG